MSECIAYRDDGSVCRRPAIAVDRTRGGAVCGEHLPRCEVCGDPTLTWDYSRERHICAQCLAPPEDAKR